LNAAERLNHPNPASQKQPSQTLSYLLLVMQRD